MVKNSYLNTISVSVPTRGDIKKLVDILNRLMPSPYVVDYELSKGGSVLCLYVINGRTVCRLDFDLKDGLNYGLCMEAIKKAINGELIAERGWDLPYPVYTVRTAKEGKE